MISIERLSETLNKAIKNNDRDCAFVELACAYRKFALENPELYQAIIRIPRTHDEILKKNEDETIAPLRNVVERFVDNEKDIVNFQRFFRSAMHGFISLESAGFMRFSGISVDESYEMLINSCLNQLKTASRK